ncbi:hypothetical protein [Cupriavidus pauculus]|uniref:hypothetical protein n=1 Tax=Cupriavidus pauculus TaxID=82633 RepID=UPI001D0C5A89|nr:hypothetical protein [Cupriavidus pauculus]
MSPMRKVKAAGRINALRSALSDDQLETLQEAVRLALESKRAAMREAVKAGHQLTEADFGIPKLEALDTVLGDAYEIVHGGIGDQRAQLDRFLRTI